MKNILKYLFLVIIPAILLWGGYTIDYPTTEFSIFKEGNFDRIKAMHFSMSDKPGAPELPVVFLNYIIPPNASVESIIVNRYTTHRLPGEYIVYPSQKVHYGNDSFPWTGPDTSVYNSDSLFPNKYIQVVGVGVIDGARIITLKIQPLQYRPKSKRLFLTRNIYFELAFKQTNLPELRPNIRGVYEQQIYETILRNAVVNDNEINVYYQKPLLIEEGLLAGIPPLQYAAGVIITPYQFWENFSPYRDWMTDQGLKTVLVDPQSIYSSYTGCDNAEKIRNFIKYCYQNYGGTYFILGGDENILPIRYASKTRNPNWLDSIPCDLYFSDLSGNWDVDGDQKWGEMTDDQADPYPEVFVGRITSINENEVSNWVYKVLNYEKTPGLILDSILWIRSDAIDTCVIRPVFPSHINHFIAQENNADSSLKLINKGYGFVNFHCHGQANLDWVRVGTTNGYINNYWSSTPSADHAGLNYLNNRNKYFLSYSMACHNGGYDSHEKPVATDTCIADAFIDAYKINSFSTPDTGPFGAAAYLGNTRTGAFTSQGQGPSFDLEYAFYLRIMNPWWFGGGPPEPSITRIGVAEAMSKCDTSIHWSDTLDKADRHVCYANNLFGSPYTEAWTKTPGNMIVTHPSQIPVGVQTQFTVTVKDASNENPLKYAKVCLNKTDDIYLVNGTNDNGQVTFSIKPKTIGQMKITVTRLHNADNNYNQYRPSQTYCQIVMEGGGGQSLKNDNHLPDKLCISSFSSISHRTFSMVYGVPKAGIMSIIIYNAYGSKVIERNYSISNPGYYATKYNIERYSNGIYFILIKQNNNMVVNKFIII